MFSKKFLISVLILGYCAIPASATLVGYCSVATVCDTSGFATATAGDTFSNISVTAGNLVGDDYTDLGASFSDPAGITLDTSLSGWPAGGAIVANAGVNTMTITLPSIVNAIEFYVGSQDFSNFT